MCQKSNSEIKGTWMEFLDKINENKTKEKNSFFLHGKHKKWAVRCRRLGFQIL